jgi:hypothetical protein
MLEQIRIELKRLAAETIAVQDDIRSVLAVRVELDHKWCFLGADGFLRMLGALHDGAGARVVKKAIRADARHGSSWATW